HHLRTAKVCRYCVAEFFRPLRSSRVVWKVSAIGPVYPQWLRCQRRVATAAMVESRMGAVAWGLWPTPRFPSPLVKPGVPISGTRLSDWLHRKAHGDKLTARGFGTVSNSPSPSTQQPPPPPVIV